MSTITIASFFLTSWWFRFLWQTKFIFTIFCQDCFTLHENPSLIDLLPGFKRNERLKRKENSLKTIYLFFWITFTGGCCHLSKLSLFRNFDLIPFRSTLWWRCLTYHLGSTHPYSITVFMEPFSTSVFKFYFVILLSLWRLKRRRSHLNICYYYQDLY